MTAWLLALGFVLLSLSQARAEPLVIASSTDTAAFAPILAAFAAQAPEIELRYHEMDSIPLHAAVLAGTLPEPADIIISSAVDRQFRLANDGFALHHRSTRTARLPDWARFADAVFGFTYEPLVLVASRQALAGRPPPVSRAALLDLLEREGEALAPVATYDPLTSGLGNLSGKIDHATNSQWGPFITRAAHHGLKTYCCSADMLAALDRGEVSLAFNVLGSYASQAQAAGSQIDILYPADYTLVIARTALILRSARHPRAASRFIDFLLSDDAQTLLAGPARMSAILPVPGPGLGVASIRVQAAGPLRPVALDATLLAYSDPLHQQAFVRLWQALTTQP